MEEDYLYSVNQVAIIMKVHQLTIRRYIREGKLKAVKMGGNIRVPKSGLELFSKQIQPYQAAQKDTRAGEATFSFSLDDPIFRVKGRGLSLRPLKLDK